MPGDGLQKVRLLIIYDYLTANTDENNHLSTHELIVMLKERGIEINDRTLHKNILLLNEHGFEVNYYKKKCYYYYITDRTFDVPEIKILIDALQAANFISEEKTQALTAKLASLAGKHQAEILQRNIVFRDTHKHTNKYLYYNVDALHTAITGHKKRRFCIMTTTHPSARSTARTGRGI